jgi:hypothetical protein
MAGEAADAMLRRTGPCGLELLLEQEALKSVAAHGQQLLISA